MFLLGQAKSIDREGLGESCTGAGQGTRERAGNRPYLIFTIIQCFRLWYLFVAFACRQYAECCLVVGSFQVMPDSNATTVQSCQRLVLIAFDVSICLCRAVKRETSPNDFTPKTCSFTAVLKAVVAIYKMFFNLVSEPT